MTPNGPVAAIDCGTNSTRLLVADASGQPLERLMRITRLGEGVDATGRLSPEAIDRCIDVVREYRGVIDRLEAVSIRLVATSAVRDAANGEVFLHAAAEASGVQPELLTGIEEGRLSLAGAVAELDPGDGPFLIVDIGGGSTELVVGSGPDDPAVDAVSLQLGCVRILERFFHHDPPTADELATAQSAVMDTLDGAAGAHSRFAEARRLVGLAGTVSTISALQQGLDDYDRSRIHHSVLTAAQVKEWFHRLAGENTKARLARPGLVPGRADVIVGGALVLDAVMSRFGFDQCLVSESDILDGLVASQL
ncbi:MAG: exopolyphosphatase / guanosine-5-triphosphate,3-diphosphate pyrophosphatase [Acidimicrobiaceae bacterium]|jgi:exopolyphosphatase/guanosine-5'-triphosphate,3'-diphosphate pyrophosphatase|nr:exopolyphosphatase / guanosine-5-triphosphate,3-diphosphate pyrophosphatase [Acidimicrobiaceae bacterium]